VRVRFDVKTMPAGRQLADVGLADVNGDGHPDILTADAGGRSLVLLFGDGRGRFAPAPGSPIVLPIAPHLVAVGRFHGTMPPDFVLTGHDSNDAVVVSGGNSIRPISSFTAIEGVAPHNHGLVVADVNGDGVEDILTSNNSGNSISVLLGSRFLPAPGSPFRVGRAPYPLAVEDFNGDGKPDVATPDVQGGTVTVLFGDGRGSFAPARDSPYRVDQRPFFALAARVNSDRAPDLVISHDDISTVTVLVNDGRGRFRSRRTFDAGRRTWKIRAADFDGDGHTDLVTGLPPSSVAVFLGDGDGGFRPAAGSPFGVGRGPWNLAVADLNHDGKTDVVTANGDDGSVSILLAR
jgi:hypothetical protein